MKGCNHQKERWLQAPAGHMYSPLQSAPEELKVRRKLNREKNMYNQLSMESQHGRSLFPCRQEYP